MNRIIRTDGRTWRILIRDAETGTWGIDTEIPLPAFGQGLDCAIPWQGGAAFNVPRELCGLVEFLRRAMIPGRDLEALAKQAASYGRELVHWLMVAEDAPRLERFIDQLQRRHGLGFDTLMPEWQAAKTIAYGLLLDTVLKAWTPKDAPPNPLDGGPDWSVIAECGAQAIPTEILAEVSDLIRRSASLPPWAMTAGRTYTATADVLADDATTDFCATIWRELAGSDTEDAAFSGAARGIDRNWVDNVWAAAIHSRHWESPPTLIVFGTDAGTSAVRAASVAAKYFGSVIMHTAAFDPVAYSTMKFRLVACRQLLMSRGREVIYLSTFGISPTAGLGYHPVLRNTVLLCDFLRRFPSGVKEESPEDDFTFRFNQALALVREQGSAPAAFRLPVDFLDGKEYTGFRQQLFDAGHSLWVSYDDSQERPRDKRLIRGFATVILDAGEDHPILPPAGYEKLEATPKPRYCLLSTRGSTNYRDWPELPGLAAVPPLNGPVERRGMTLIDLDREALGARVRDYLSGEVSDEYIAAHYPDMMKDGPRFNAKLSRRKLRAKKVFNPGYLTAYPFRPFDCRTAYLREMRPLFSDPAADLQVIATIEDNWFLVVGEAGRFVDGPPAWASREPCDYDFFAGRSRHFPVRLPEAVLAGRKVRLAHGHWDYPENLNPRANLSPAAKAYLNRMGYSHPDLDWKGADDLWHFVLAVLYTPRYAEANRDALRMAWPRIPLPGWEDRHPSLEAWDIFRRGAELGGLIHELLTDRSTKLLDIIPEVASIRRGSDGDPVAPDRLTEAERTITAPWGVPAKGRAVRAQKGKVKEQPYGAKLSGQIVDLARAMGLEAGECLHHLGNRAVDVFLNDEVRWTDIPEAAWKYMIGGRSVLGKWLSYRDVRIMARPLAPEESAHFAATARRLSVLALIALQLDTLWPKLEKPANK